MLLSSHRHLKKDLAYWESLSRLDQVRGDVLAMRKRETGPVAAIRRFTESTCYASTSWGKDSVVMCHLLVLSGAGVPVVHIVQEGPQKDPDQHRVRDAFLACYDVDYHEIVVEHDPSRVHKDDGIAHFPALDIGIREARKRFGPRWIGGLRAGESGQRRNAIKSTRRRDAKSCWPIGRWSAADVYAWLALHDLPIHPAYGYTEGGIWDRERIRIGILGGPKGVENGRRAWEWRYYPDIMARLVGLGVIPPWPREAPAQD